MSLLTVAALCTGAGVVPTAFAFERFVQKIPNADGFKNIKALGHVNGKGGGELNAFGVGFERAGKLWTEEFCNKDSDGDGQTNGEELGDPCCSWRETGNIAYMRGISDPSDPTSRTNPLIFQNIQCTKSAEAVADAERQAKKTKQPKKTLKPITDVYDELHDSSNSGNGTDYDLTNEDPSAGQTGAGATLSISSAVMGVAIAWVVLL